MKPKTWLSSFSWDADFGVQNFKGLMNTIYLVLHTLDLSIVLVKSSRYTPFKAIYTIIKVIGHFNTNTD